MFCVSNMKHPFFKLLKARVHCTPVEHGICVKHHAERVCHPFRTKPQRSPLQVLGQWAGLWVFLGLSILAMGYSPTAHANQIEKDIEILQRASKARAHIISQVSASVVHISVVHGQKVRKNGAQDDPRENFFKRFFPPGTEPFNPKEEGPQRRQGLGAGFVVSGDGYIVTNSHVVRGASRITVKTKSGAELEAKIIGTDNPTDLAVIKVSPKGHTLFVAKFGSSEELKVGETVLAIGNPFGLEQTVTQGIVSAKGRTQVGISDYEDFIQTDASINPGNSGGPLINLKGEVVGINTAIVTGRFGQYAGIGFAIPVKMAQRIMQDLIANGKVVRGFLGVVIQNVDKNLAQALSLKTASGVLIARIGRASPASRAGLKQGDVITSFDNHSTPSVEILRTRVAAIKPGKKILVKLIRDGKPRSVVVELGRQPSDIRTAFQEGGTEKKYKSKPPKEEIEKVLGLRVRNHRRNNKTRGSESPEGVLVVGVRPNSTAADAGLRRGMVVQEVNRRKVRNVTEFKAAIGKAKSDTHILLLLRINQTSRYLSVKKP